MIEVHLPTTDRRELLFTRYTQPESELRLLLDKLKLQLPAQPLPKISWSISHPRCSEDLLGPSVRNQLLRVFVRRQSAKLG
jgi:hypothetical protein